MGKKKPIQDIQIDASDGYKVAFVLWDAAISMLKWDLSYFIMRVKDLAMNVTCMRRDFKEGSHRIACCVKKKLFVMYYVSDNCIKLREHVLPESVSHMEWYGRVLALGFKRQYCLIDVDAGMPEGGQSSGADAVNAGNPSSGGSASTPSTSTPTPDAPSSNIIYTLDLNKGSHPQMTLMQSELVIVSGKIGVFIHVDEERKGEPVSRPPIPWSATPIAIGSCFPYIVVVQDGQVEIFNIYDRTDMLTKSVDNVRFLSSDNDKMGLFLASADSVYLLSPIPFQKQVESLIQKVRCTEAFELFERTFEGPHEEKMMLLSQMSQDAGFNCLFAQKVDDAFHYFAQASQFDVRELLIYFPRLIPDDFIPQRPVQKPVDLGEKFFLELQSKTQNNFKPMDRQKNKDLSEQLFTHACEKLMHFLEIRRRSDVLTKEQVALDTGLAKLYLQFDRIAQLETFLRKHNNVNTVQIVDELRQVDEYLVALLYRSKQQYKLALEILHHINNRKCLQEAIAVLKECSDEQVVFRYAEWIMEVEPAMGIHIFTTTRRKVSLNAANVVRFLKRLQKDADEDVDTLGKDGEPTSGSVGSGASSVGSIAQGRSSAKPQTNVSLLRTYLEFIITEENNTEPQYHTQLALLYIDLLTTKSTPPEVKQGVRPKFHVHLTSSVYYDTEYILKRLMDTPLFEERIFVYHRLGMHVEVLNLYLKHLSDTQSALRYCLDTIIEDESVAGNQSGTTANSNGPANGGVAQNNLGSNGGTTQLNISNTTTPQKSSTALPAVFRQHQLKQLRSDRFIALIKVCFKYPKYNSFGIQVLNQYSENMDAHLALLEIPDHIDLKSVHTFLSKSILNVQQTRRETTVMKSMYSSRFKFAKEEYDQTWKSYVRIKSSATCCVCGKLMGKKIVARYPDGSLAHYSCRRDKPHIHPVNGRNFRVEPGSAVPERRHGSKLSV